jgi:hypothetical protein
MRFKNFIFCLFNFCFYYKKYMCYGKRRKLYIRSFFHPKLTSHYVILHVSAYLCDTSLEVTFGPWPLRAVWPSHGPKPLLLLLFNFFFFFFFILTCGSGRTTPMGHGGGLATPISVGLGVWPSHPQESWGGRATPKPNEGDFGQGRSQGVERGQVSPSPLKIFLYSL